MRNIVVIALLLPACNMVEMPVLDGGVGGTGGVSRGEQCQMMQQCGRDNCAIEVQGVGACLAAGCTDDEVDEAYVTRAECLEANGCNSTSCDLVALATGEECLDLDDAELVSIAIDAMVSEEALAVCVALE